MVCVRLTGGASAHATWLLEDGPGGTSISIGTDPGCDWKIRAACVPAHALSVMLFQGKVFVRSGPDGGVVLNGRPLADGWQELDGDARIDIGLARLELSIGTAATLGDGVARWVVRNIEIPCEELGATPTMLVDADEVQPEVPWHQVTEQADQSGVRPSFHDVRTPPASGSREADRPTRTSWFERFSRPSWADAPSLLGKPSRAPRAYWWYATGCALLAGSYVAWLALLGR